LVHCRQRLSPWSDAKSADPVSPGASSVSVEVREGLGYARRTNYLWATVLCALAAVLFVVGPLEVLLPFAVRDNLGDRTDACGVALASYRIAAILLVAGLVAARLGIIRVLNPLGDYAGQLPDRQEDEGRAYVASDKLYQGQWADIRLADGAAPMLREGEHRVVRGPTT